MECTSLIGETRYKIWNFHWIGKYVNEEGIWDERYKRSSRGPSMASSLGRRSKQISGSFRVDVVSNYDAISYDLMHHEGWEEASKKTNPGTNSRIKTMDMKVRTTRGDITLGCNALALMPEYSFPVLVMSAFRPLLGIHIQWIVTNSARSNL